MKPCPKCGKPMVEAPKFPGLWQCPDYRTPINDGPPFEFKCRGIAGGNAAAAYEEVKSKN